MVSKESTQLQLPSKYLVFQEGPDLQGMLKSVLEGWGGGVLSTLLWKGPLPRNCTSSDLRRALTSQQCMAGLPRVPCGDM